MKKAEGLRLERPVYTLFLSVATAICDVVKPSVNGCRH